jgi:hypothetical protein
MGETVVEILTFILISMLSVGFLVVAALVLMIRKLRNIEVPYDADLFTTMHYVPLTLVVLLDLLDLSLDIFSAPVSWLILDRMGLSSLRNVSTIQGVIPGTQLIPVMTLSWMLARLLGLGHPSRSYAAYSRPYAPASRRYLEDEAYMDDDLYDDDGYEVYEPRTRSRRRSARIIDMDDVER